MSGFGRHYSRWFWLYISLFNLTMIFVSSSIVDGGRNLYVYDASIYQNAVILTWGVGEIILILLGIIFSLKNRVIVLKRQRIN